MYKRSKARHRLGFIRIVDLLKFPPKKGQQIPLNIFVFLHPLPYSLMHPCPSLHSSWAASRAIKFAIYSKGTSQFVVWITYNHDICYIIFPSSMWFSSGQGSRWCYKVIVLVCLCWRRHCDAQVHPYFFPLWHAILLRSNIARPPQQWEGARTAPPSSTLLGIWLAVSMLLACWGQDERWWIGSWKMKIDLHSS